MVGERLGERGREQRAGLYRVQTSAFLSGGIPQAMTKIAGLAASE